MFSFFLQEKNKTNIYIYREREKQTTKKKGQTLRQKVGKRGYDLALEQIVRLSLVSLSTTNSNWCCGRKQMRQRLTGTLQKKKKRQVARTLYIYIYIYIYI